MLGHCFIESSSMAKLSRPMSLSGKLETFNDKEDTCMYVRTAHMHT